MSVTVANPIGVCFVGRFLPWKGRIGVKPTQFELNEIALAIQAG